jgi:uncharacterized NAD(P)/FAD-binding protein YdhS
VAIFEKTEDFGPGFPHNGRYLMPFHITNMCAADMGVYADRPGDFQAWVNQNLDKLKSRFDTFPTEVFEPSSHHCPCKHYPRAFMGEYLRSLFYQALRAARQLGIAVRLYPLHEITDVRQEGRTVRLTALQLSADSRLDISADAVLLATGHWFSKRQRENYFDSPWPAAKLLAGIPPGASVAVIGTSLSAIETILTLTSDGQFVRDAGSGLIYVPSPKPRKITLYSRRGLLPRVRGRKGSYTNKFLTLAALKKSRQANNGRLTLNATFKLLDRELESAYGRPIDWTQVLNPGERPTDILTRYLKEAENGDGPGGELIWQTVLTQTFPFIKEWYWGLTAEDRKRFDREYTSVFFTHAATQPGINASKLLALLKEELVRVVKLGMRYRFYRDERRACYQFDYTDADGQRRSDAYQYVVNAQGQQISLETDPSALARNLLAWRCDQAEIGQTTYFQGEQAALSGAFRTGSLLIDPHTHQVLPLCSNRSRAGAVYAVGAMTRGQIINASMAHGIAQATAMISDNLLNDLTKASRRN